MLYRFIGLERIEKILHDRRDYLVHPSKWRDPYEWSFLDANVLYPMYVYDGKMTSKPPPDGIKFKLSNWMRDDENHGRAHFIYGQCWSTRSESAALWRTPDKYHVRIAIDEDVLCNRIESAAQGNQFYIDKVTYDSSDEIKTRRDTFISKWRPHRGHRGSASEWFSEITSLLLEKRTDFDFEEELRIIIFDENGYLLWRKSQDPKIGVPLAERNDMPKLYGYKIDFNSDIHSILLHPELNKQEYQSQMAQINELGITVPVSKSQLYSRRRIFDTWGEKPISR